MSEEIRCACLGLIITSWSNRSPRQRIQKWMEIFRFFFVLKKEAFGPQPGLRMRRPSIRMAARGQSPPGTGSALEESEVVGVWGRRSAHTTGEAAPPYLLLPLQLRMQCRDPAASTPPLRFVSASPSRLPLLPPHPRRHCRLFPPH